MTSVRSAPRRAWPAYVAVWLVVWSALLVRTAGAAAAAAAGWPIAALMVLGSLVAGSMPIGGGAIAFPVLVLALGNAPAMARDFALAIQSVGMTSALMFIVSRGIPVAWPLVGWTTLGAAAGLLFGTFGLARWLAPEDVKLVFATAWLAFAIGLVVLSGSSASRSSPGPSPGTPRITGLLIGVTGGAIAAVLGTGVEMLVYTVLVFRDRWSPRAAVPSAVCAMALAAPMGLGLRAIATGIHPAVWGAWLAAVPVVLFGAPAGAFLSTRLPQRVLVRCIAALCVVQFVVTLAQVRPGPAEWLGIVASLVAVVTIVGRWTARASVIEREVGNAARFSNDRRTAGRRRAARL